MTTGAHLLRKLSRDPAAILTAADSRFLEAEAGRLLGGQLAEILSERGSLFRDLIRWRSIAKKCATARAQRGLSIRDVSRTLHIPQYRLNAIENGSLTYVRPNEAREYFQFLGIMKWLSRWKRANRDLALRVGLSQKRLSTKKPTQRGVQPNYRVKRTRAWRESR